jgi:hypothetical protein
MASVKTTPKTKRSQWIAERALERRDAIGGRVLVRLGYPEPDPDCPYGNDWRCPYAISGLGDDTIHFAHSIDAIGAIQNAFTGIRSKLVKSGIPLRRPGFREDFIGFPMHVPWEFGFEFYTQVEKVVEAEVEKRMRAMKERHELQQASPKTPRKARKKP